jgi:hypothetical protein
VVEASRQFIERSRQRGATIFVVVLVITLLMGIGSFAARSAHLATAASGSERQMVQARYVAEYGMMFATAKLSNPAAQSFLDAMAHPTATTLCNGQTAAMPGRSCYQMLATDVTTELTSGGLNICDPAAPPTPGSLGLSNTQCDFRVELTDLSPGPVAAGNSGASSNSSGPGGSNPSRFWYITGTSTGQVRIVNTGGAALDPTSAESTSTQTLRSRIVAGPCSLQN